MISIKEKIKGLFKKAYTKGEVSAANLKEEIKPQETFLDKMKRVKLMDYLAGLTIFFDYEGSWYNLHATPEQIKENLEKLYKENNIGRAINVEKNESKAFKDPLTFMAYVINNKDKWELLVK